MKIEDLLRRVPVLEKHHWEPGRKINKVTSDSRNIEPGDLFVACPGARMDGHDFIGQAVQAGATAIVYDRETEFIIPKQVIRIRVPDARKGLGLLLKHYYGEPDESIKVVGVTGTNGKTTVAYLLYSLLKDRVPCGYIGTLWYEFGGRRLAAMNTTPGPEVLYPLMAEMQSAGINYCFMEVSSHALEQRRVHGLQFELAIFTQLTQDHLDYHKTMERYYQSKRLFFVEEPKPKKTLINGNCNYGRRLLEEQLTSKSYAIGYPSDYTAENIDCSVAESKFMFVSKLTRHPFKIQMPMRHNVSNAVGVLAALEMLGFEPATFEPVFRQIRGVPGRLERIGAGEAFEVFVDYAHTPDAVEHVVSAARQLRPKRILTLMGCGGDRDRDKRPLMAGAAASYSDILVLTSDNPRTEDPESILKDMKKGMPSPAEGKPLLFEILDRRRAIEKIISLAEPGDLVLILGKGHEDYQILGDNKIPFDDRLVVQEALKSKSRVILS